MYEKLISKICWFIILLMTLDPWKFKKKNDICLHRRNMFFSWILLHVILKDATEDQKILIILKYIFKILRIVYKSSIATSSKVFCQISLDTINEHNKIKIHYEDKHIQKCIEINRYIRSRLKLEIWNKRYSNFERKRTIKLLI